MKIYTLITPEEITTRFGFITIGYNNNQLAPTLEVIAKAIHLFADEDEDTNQLIQKIVDLKEIINGLKSCVKHETEKPNYEVIIDMDLNIDKMILTIDSITTNCPKNQRVSIDLIRLFTLFEEAKKFFTEV